MRRCGAGVSQSAPEIAYENALTTPDGCQWMARWSVGRPAKPALDTVMTPIGAGSASRRGSCSTCASTATLPNVPHHRSSSSTPSSPACTGQSNTHRTTSLVTTAGPTGGASPDRPADNPDQRLCAWLSPSQRQQASYRAKRHEAYITDAHRLRAARSPNVSGGRYVGYLSQTGDARTEVSTAWSPSNRRTRRRRIGGA